MKHFYSWVYYDKAEGVDESNYAQSVLDVFNKTVLTVHDNISNGHCSLMFYCSEDLTYLSKARMKTIIDMIIDSVRNGRDKQLINVLIDQLKRENVALRSAGDFSAFSNNNRNNEEKPCCSMM